MSKLNTKDFVRQIEKITKQRMAEEKVVSLQDFRQLKKTVQKRNILVIEDDESIRKALVRLFSGEDHHVLAAADGTQLASVLDDTMIDLIILDIGLPWINGFELASLMKENVELQAIPIVFISGQASDSDLKRAFKIGADDFVKKPFTLEKIKKTVLTLLELHTEAE